MKYARIANGSVAEVIDLPDGVSVGEAFHPDIAPSFREVGPEVSAGWTFDGEKFRPPVPAAVTQDLLSYAAAQRWRKEVGGLSVSGLHIATDDRSKQMILGARIAADADPEFTTKWIGTDGSINTLNASQIIAISNAVLAHVSSCFDDFATVRSLIDDGTITTAAEVDAAFG